MRMFEIVLFTVIFLVRTDARWKRQASVTLKYSSNDYMEIGLAGT